jgi:hypothetical protein
MPAAEPSRAALANPLLRDFLATRPAFLAVPFYGCPIARSAGSYDSDALPAGAAALTLPYALTAARALR